MAPVTLQKHSAHWVTGFFISKASGATSLMHVERLVDSTSAGFVFV